jgi:ankyrin repeat protein
MPNISFSLDTIGPDTLRTLIRSGTSSLWDRVLEDYHIDMVACWHENEHNEPPVCACRLIACSIKTSNFALSKLLVNRGADMHVMDCSNELEFLPLVLALQVENFDLFKLVLARYTSPLSDQFYIAISAAMYYLMPCRNQAEVDCLKMLCVHRADAELTSQKQSRFKSPYPQGRFNDTVLHQAAARGDYEAVRVLLDCGADPNVLDHKGRSALELYICEASMEEDDYLCTKDLDAIKVLREMDDNKNALRNNKELVQELLEAMVLLDDDDETVQHVLTLYFEDNCSWRMYKPDMKSPLHYAAEKGNCALLKQLIDRGDYVHVRNQLSETPIMIAARFGSHEALITLLELGASVEDVDCHGLTVFSTQAGRNSNLEVTAAILANALNPEEMINRFSDFGLSALYLAIVAAQIERSNKYHEVEFLIENGASLDLRSATTGCAIHAASFFLACWA